MESPLPGGPPSGPFAGAKWKAALAFRQDAPMHVFVVDAAGAPSVWSSKYMIREKLRKKVDPMASLSPFCCREAALDFVCWRMCMSSASRASDACSHIHRQCQTILWAMDHPSDASFSVLGPVSILSHARRSALSEIRACTSRMTKPTALQHGRAAMASHMAPATSATAVSLVLRWVLS